MAIFGPSKWPVYLGSVRAISGLPNRQTAEIASLGRYITAHGPSMVRLLNAARANFGPPGIFKSEGLEPYPVLFDH